jgi:hypothetical protein
MFRTVVLGMVLAAMAPAGIAVAEPVGFVAGVEGSIEMFAIGASAWTAAMLDSEVQIGDTLRTGPSAAVKILLVDDTLLSIGEDTEVVIDSMLVGPAATGEASVLQLLRGQMRARVGEAFGGPTRLEVHTPTAVAGVKGTEFECEAEQQRTLCCNFGGGVFVRNRELGFAGTLDIPAGFCSEVLPRLRPSDPEPPPATFQSVGGGPSAGVQGGHARVLLFAAPSGGGEGGHNWVVSPPPVGSGPGEISELNAGIASSGEGYLEDGVETTVLEGVDVEPVSLPPLPPAPPGPGDIPPGPPGPGDIPG